MLKLFAGEIGMDWVPDWDQHFNKKTSFKPGTIGVMNAFNENYENEMFDKNRIFNDAALM